MSLKKATSPRADQHRREARDNDQLRSKIRRPNNPNRCGLQEAAAGAGAARLPGLHSGHSDIDETPWPQPGEGWCAISHTAQPIISATAASAEITAPSSSFLLSALRCAYLRNRIISNELECIGRAFSGGLVDTIGAIALLDDAGLLPLISASS